MPGIVTTAIAAVATAISTSAVLSAAVSIGTALVRTWVVSRLFARRSGSQAATTAGSPGSRVQLPPATTNQLPMVYGRAWVRPVVIDAIISTDQKTMWYVCALSESPYQTSGWAAGSMSIGRVRWGDKNLNFDPADPTRVISWSTDDGDSDSRVSDRIRVYRYSGSALSPVNGTTQTAQAVLQNSAIPVDQRWTSTDLMSNTVFLVVRVDYDAEVGLTGLGELTVELNNTCNRPGAAMYDYLTSDRYGCAVPPARIHVQSLQDLDQYSDQMIMYTQTIQGQPVVQQQPRFRVNGPVDTLNDCFQNLQIIAESADSWVQWNEATAQWGVVINRGYDQAAGSQPALTLNQLFSITDHNLIGPISITPVDLNSTYNRVEVTYPDARLYDSAGFAYIDLDAGTRNPNEPDSVLNMTLQLVNNDVQAKYIATRRLIQSREDLSVQCTLDHSGIQVDAGDLVRMTNSRYQWQDRVFRVTQVQEGRDDLGMLTASLVLQEYNPQVYGNIDITEFVPIANTGITDPNLVSVVAAPTVSGVIQTGPVPEFQVNVQTPSTGTVVAVEIWASSSGDTLGNYSLLRTLRPTGTSFAAGSTQSASIVSLSPGTWYFRARARTPSGSTGAFSAASTAFVWNPTVEVPSSLGTSLDWTPAGVFVLSASDGSNPVLGQVGSLYLRVGAETVNVWNRSGTQPLGTWTWTSLVTSSGITASGPVANTQTNTVTVTVTGCTVDSGSITLTGIKYLTPGGVLVDLGNAVLPITRVRSGAAGAAGAPGVKTAQAQLSQWSAVQPATPTGTSIWTWGTASHASYSGGGGWSTTVPANPGTPGVRLWTAVKSFVADGTALTTTLNWNTVDYQVREVSSNGLNGTPGVSGVQSAYPEVYRWSLTTPTISGTSTYNWNDGLFTPVPTNWSTTITAAPSPGWTLWAARVAIIDAATVTSSSINWSTASIIARGYAGTNGTNGATGAAGASARRAYARIPGNPAPVSGIITTTGDTRPTQAQSNSTWGLNYAWSALDPNPASVDSLFQVDGAYNPATNQTTWDTPYLASLRVGQLSAITTNTGNLTVSGQILSGNASRVNTAMTGSGAVISSGGTFALGNASRSLVFNGTTLTLNGSLVTTNNIQAGAITADKLAAGSITADKLAAGAIITSSVQLSANVVTADKISNISLTGTNNFDVKTAASGQRMEITNRAIKVFDANGVLRVQIGDLTA